MFRRSRSSMSLFAAMLVLAVALPTTTLATHSWDDHHWDPSVTPVPLTLRDAVYPSAWVGYLDQAKADWDVSTKLNLSTTSQPGVDVKKCSPVTGKVTVCSNTYGKRGWLGVARIWTDGHIYQASVQLNDSYLLSGYYGTKEWRKTVICQEIGHVFGLTHQDEDFYNATKPTCMDYSLKPQLTMHPDAHDYEQLELIYDHVSHEPDGGDEPTNPGNGRGKGRNRQGVDQSDWGRRVAVSNSGNTTIHELKIGGGKRIITFVTWVPSR
jgi:hypothetical protein